MSISIKGCIFKYIYWPSMNNGRRHLFWCLVDGHFERFGTKSVDLCGFALNNFKCGGKVDCELAIGQRQIESHRKEVLKCKSTLKANMAGPWHAQKFHRKVSTGKRGENEHMIALKPSTIQMLNFRAAVRFANSFPIKANNR